MMENKKELPPPSSLLGRGDAFIVTCVCSACKSKGVTGVCHHSGDCVLPPWLQDKDLADFAKFLFRDKPKGPEGKKRGERF